MYTIAVKSKYAKIQYYLCPRKLQTNRDVNTFCTVTLHQAAKATTSGGQGLFDVIVEMVKKM